VWRGGDQAWFYGKKLPADSVVDCGGNILAPGFIDVQINGAFGVSGHTYFGIALLHKVQSPESQT
jgi:N-acetylglucosamine-6-phosphate deacetylase